jgi:hypothetical protein
MSTFGPIHVSSDTLRKRENNAILAWAFSDNQH